MLKAVHVCVQTRMLTNLTMEFILSADFSVTDYSVTLELAYSSEMVRLCVFLAMACVLPMSVRHHCNYFELREQKTKWKNTAGVWFFVVFFEFLLFF